HTTIRFVLFA
ncbi:hypothetical protein CFOL_v3_24009, partial [Cephalotus follicularis]